MTRNQFLKKLKKEANWISDTAIKRMLCGKSIGGGSSREVFECKLHPDFVVKVQYNGGFDNAIEYEIWSAICEADWWAKWFAESVYISRTGKILIQQKIDFKESKKEYPKKIPRFFTDIKVTNYGFVGNQLKCCDYSGVLGRLTGFMDKKMRVAKWYVPLQW